jgi:FPC/CPF motif-containing protein YcgG
MLPAALDNDHPLAMKFRQFVAKPTFPCVGAKAALSRGQLDFVVARDITSAWDDLRIYPALFNFAKRYRPRRKLFQSFVVIFQGPRSLTEREFEHSLWERLQSLTDKDEWHGQRHDPAVSADPANPHFSLSFAGEGFFCVGLHPKASRPARRFPLPVIVFNLHDQFEELRKDGLYDKLHDKIMDRDLKLAGSLNPMLQKHGDASEARQYSGRAVGETWKCPFHREAKKSRAY